MTALPHLCANLTSVTQRVNFVGKNYRFFFFLSPPLFVQIVFPDAERDLKKWEVIDLLTYAKPRKKLYRSQLCIDKQGLVKFAAKRISRSFSTRRRRMEGVRGGILIASFGLVENFQIDIERFTPRFL